MSLKDLLPKPNNADEFPLAYLGNLHRTTKMLLTLNFCMGNVNLNFSLLMVLDLRIYK